MTNPVGMEILYLSGIIISGFLALVLFTKAEKTVADYVLAGWIAACGMTIIPMYLYEKQLITQFPTLFVFFLPLPALQGVLLYLYTKYQTTPILFRKRDLLHFAPMGIIYLMFIPFFLLPHEEKVAVIRSEGAGYNVQNLVRIIFIYLSGIVYIPLSLARLLKFRKSLADKFSNTDKINFQWLLYLTIGLGAIWLIVLFYQEDWLIYSSTTIFILWIGYFGIKQVKVFSQKTIEQADIAMPYIKEYAGENKKEQDKYAKSSLDETLAQKLHTRLSELLENEKVYKNPELTLSTLAQLLQTSPNHLSQVINSIDNKSFYDLINEYRVQEFLRLVANPENRKYTLITLAYDCGFNSKASFNRNFKKHMGTTPSEYLKADLN